MKKIVFVGTAGAGKSTLTAAFDGWMHDNGHDCVIMNLDPGAEELAYEPDIDIREWVRLEEVMKDYTLGPNGAQIVASDLLALNMDKVLEPIEKLDADYLLVDTPGQLELFAYRQSGKVVIDRLGTDETVLAFVTEPAICRSPGGFISSSMLFASVNFRFEVPALNIISKVDLIPAEELEKILHWAVDEMRLYNDLVDEDLRSAKSLTIELFKALQQVSAYTEMIPISSKERTGMEDIYSKVQDIFYGGEDLDRRIS